MSGSVGAESRLRWLGYGACALACSIWSTGFYLGRLALDEMSVEYMVLYRFLFACVGLLPVALMARVRLTWAETRLLLISTALGIPAPFLLQYHGLEMTTVSHAALMVGTVPVMLAGAAALFTRERLDRVGWVALFGSAAGVLLITLGGTRAQTGREHPSLEGDLLVILAMAFSIAWVLTSKKLMETHIPTVVSAYTVLAGTAMLAGIVLGPRWVRGWIPNGSAPMPFAHVSATAWTALAVSGLAGTALSTFLWNWGIHHVPASRAGVFLNIEPALGSLLGVKLLGERLGPYAWLGGGLILAAAVTLTTRGHEVEPEVIIE